MYGTCGAALLILSSETRFNSKTLRLMLGLFMGGPKTPKEGSRVSGVPESEKVTSLWHTCASNKRQAMKAITVTHKKNSLFIVNLRLKQVF